MKREITTLKQKRGSITIEASISLVAFTCCMLVLISIINICRLQAAIGNAMNKSVLELSQYTYFLDVTGIYHFDSAMQEIAGERKKDLNTIITGADEAIAGTEQLFKMLENSGKDLNKMVEDGELKGDSIESTYKELKKTYEEIGTKAEDITGQIGRLEGAMQEIIFDNPLDFIKGLVAIGISETMDKAKSHAIAAPLVKRLCINHFDFGEGSNKKEGADIYLRKLGLVNGLDGLDFRLSTLFAPDSNTDINMVVVYKARPIPLIRGLEVTFAQSASTKGWLGGDRQR